MQVHFVVHEAFEAPGAYEQWVAARGYQAGYSRVYLGEPLPPSAADIDLLIVMGGPQSPATTTADCPHFDAAAEQQLIARCITAGKAVVGVCLGSQLIGEALGAAHGHSPEKEIGKFPITLTEAGRLHPLLAHFGEQLAVGHWHNDMPGLTPDARILAYSAGCPRQIIEYAPLAYGFQCHMEFTPEVVEGLITAEAHAFPQLTERRFVQQPDVLRQQDFSEMNTKLFGFLDRLVQAYQQRG